MTPSSEERILLSVLARFESAGLDVYRAHAPQLETEAKNKVVADLLAAGAADQELAGSVLAGPVAELLGAAESANPTQAVCVQGMVLELLGLTIYAAADRAEGVSANAKQVAASAIPACRHVVDSAVGAFAELAGTGEAAFVEFSDASHDVIAALDSLAEPVDALFGPRFDIRFSELVGEFTADLVAACARLEMPRRKVLAHLAGASMGF